MLNESTLDSPGDYEMQKQQEAGLLDAFRAMDDMDRLMLLALAKNCAAEAINSKPTLRLVVDSNPPGRQTFVRGTG
jgi:hypothetical protein